MVENGIKNRLFRQSWREFAITAVTNQIEFFLPNGTKKHSDFVHRCLLISKRNAQVARRLNDIVIARDEFYLADRFC